MKLTWENRNTGGKTCPSATLSTTNPTWTDPGSNPGIRSERPTTDRLSHGTVIQKTACLTVKVKALRSFENHSPKNMAP
jgi:hypothetical protein